VRSTLYGPAVAARMRKKTAGRKEKRRGRKEKKRRRGRKNEKDKIREDF
jgi:hypothetical protein